MTPSKHHSWAYQAEDICSALFRDKQYCPIPHYGHNSPRCNNLGARFSRRREPSGTSRAAQECLSQCHQTTHCVGLTFAEQTS